MPKTLLVGEEQQSKPSVYGAAIDYAVESGQQASMIFDPKKAKGGLKVEVKGPNNEKIRHSTNKRPDETTEISFKPTGVGEYRVELEFNSNPFGGDLNIYNTIAYKSKFCIL